MNYYLIGQQIRTHRKEQGISQEQLAEKVGISVTHMSHIETGNTKLSLPVFVRLAQALDVPTDWLLQDCTNNPTPLEAAVAELLADCTASQLAVILETIKALKKALSQQCNL